MVNEVQQFDVVVIGGGPGGYAAALYGAAAGLNVALIERDKVGGTCLHRGCVPAKEFLETAHVHRTVEHSSDFGINAKSVSVDFAVSQARKNEIVDRLFKGLSGLLKGRKVTIFEGTGRLDKELTVTILDGADAGVVAKGANVILAAGSVPRTLPGFDVDGKIVVTSDEFLDLSALPARATVVGGGAIGCEFASLLSDMGSKVTILESLPSILAGCDTEVASVVQRSFKKRGIEIRVGAKITGHTPKKGSTTIAIEGEESVEADMVVMSVGRRPRTEGLLGEDTGVVVDERGFVVADSYQRTGAANVFAVGDVVAGTPQLAHVGFAEAIVAVKTILGEPVVPVDYDRVPWAIYSNPEVAFCGLTEAAAKEKGYDVVVKKDPFGGNSRAQIIGDTEGVVKIIAEKRADGTGGQILGVHMAGPWVTEQLGAGYFAVNWEATAEEAAALIQPHPSLSETFGETLLALAGRGLHVG
ncbi:MAG TPA: dihydrolipoyl dehydrogenase [Acidimicrobiales bacterium]|nr:dihydrolipoyl dehydrogenase [Acidimicrobiales bacterium]